MPASSIALAGSSAATTSGAIAAKISGPRRRVGPEDEHPRRPDEGVADEADDVV